MASAKKQQEKVIREKAIRQHIEDYAAPLPPDITFPTPFAGIRILPQLPHNAQYDYLRCLSSFWNLYS